MNRPQSVLKTTIALASLGLASCASHSSLVNLQSEIVGANDVGVGSLGGAIPSNLAKTVATELIAKGTASRSWLGIEVQPLLKQMAKGKGVLVDSVRSGGPCAESKPALKCEDMITQANEINVHGVLQTGARNAPIVRAAKLAAHFSRKVTRHEYQT